MVEEYCQAHSGMEQRISKVETDTEKQWKVLDQLRNRLPVWATIVISLLTFLLGGAITYATFAVKIAQIGTVT
jgi:NO-binding membrane sensor protein with MHYT domain